MTNPSDLTDQELEQAVAEYETLGNADAQTVEVSILWKKGGDSVLDMSMFGLLCYREDATAISPTLITPLFSNVR